jgi:signal peptidase I
MKTKTTWRWTRRITLAAAIAIVMLGMGSVLAVSLVGKFGETALGMKTGSMHPAINPGDLVLVRQVNPKAIRVGDVITFRRPGNPNEVFTHRVQSITYTGNGGVAFKTKGDANPIPDAWMISYQGPALEVVHVIRDGGIVLRVAQSQVARRVIALSIFFIVLYLLWPVIVTPSRKLDDSPLPSPSGVA